MKHNICLSIILLYFTWFEIGCSSFSVKKERLDRVKTIAMIGLDMEQQKSASVGDLFQIATKQGFKSEATVAMGVESEHVVKLYEAIVQELKNRRGWKVISYKEMKANSHYQNFLKEKTEGWQNRPVLNDRVNLFRPPGIVDFYSVTMTKEERIKELQESLGVDAVITIHVKTQLNNNSVFASVIGQGKFSPSATLTIMMKDKSGEPIWKDSVEGAKLDKSERNIMGVANEEKLNTLSVEASKLSLRALMDRLESKAL